ncbi:hypothetical protein NG800_000280 [Epilithonimonas ginsengisoli]|uniref:Uncharacterized protein n=1 Tax=Epilithonimonas ginsengisoli TaxID=1245592 RepID=A0ABU4JCC4_9FLAO|nr:MULTISPECIES: hypothetical protein [Chryseobacterium group]MBV6878433.1 hypothetical protein [Epilithonimonas sp. FP105]MDW8547324.1 hypothetical protein [Epilithonimonas ginsengisoli]OAH69077.1 hypothetical protein AXA65_16750 [Chryseobacterium sp. FP211-J200]
MNPRKITIIYPFAYGYIDLVVKELKSHSNITVTEIKTDTIKYQYPNPFAKTWNGITKLFGKNIKKEYFRNQILGQVREKQDITFIIRPDLFDVSLLEKLKKKTENFIAYYYDSCKKYPKQVDLIPFFDEIYSYENEDIEKYNFIETSNFIYDESIVTEDIRYDIFNISSYDSRIDEINRIANALSDAGLKIYFILFYFKKLSFPNLISVTEYLSLKETKKLISESRSMLDVQRIDQNGLSFRTFESLGYRKKLITTNKMVREYDFYHPNNILVINSNKIDTNEIKDFLRLPYVEIPQDILKKYNLKSFTEKIFKI